MTLKEILEYLVHEDLEKGSEYLLTNIADKVLVVKESYRGFYKDLKMHECVAEKVKYIIGVKSINSEGIPKYYLEDVFEIKKSKLFSKDRFKYKITGRSCVTFIVDNHNILDVLGHVEVEDLEGWDSMNPIYSRSEVSKLFND